MVTSSRELAGEAPTMPTIARDIRRLVIEHSYRAHVGHIGSSLSIADILAALYGSVLRGRPDERDRDRLVLSKGHAALGLFAALALTKRLDPRELESFGTPGSRLGVHPEPGVPGVDFGTGSLGQGLSIGAGAALAARMQGRASRAFVVLSDAELNEGAVWESAQFAGHHRLRNLVAVVDLNGQQAFGNTADVLSIRDPAGAFAAFGWEVARIDGHDHNALVEALDVTDREGPPRVVFATTVFGRGVSFMERQLKWHYLPMDDEQYARAVAELAGA
jgi:transketolase